MPHAPVRAGCFGGGSHERFPFLHVVLQVNAAGLVGRHAGGVVRVNDHGQDELIAA